MYMDMCLLSPRAKNVTFSINQNQTTAHIIWLWKEFGWLGTWYLFHTRFA